MFVGHIALALAAKRPTRVSLGLLVIATEGLDLLWPVFLVLGIERVRIEPGVTAINAFAFDSYPWSHSLVMALVWGALLALVCTLRGIERRSALLIGALVVSHWFLDFASHRADMPLWPGPSPLLGLGLWHSIAATFVVEGALYAAGIALYVRATRARDRIGSWGFWILIAVFAAMWAAGPWSPPPSADVLAWSAFGLWLFILWAWWVDRHRDLADAG